MNLTFFKLDGLVIIPTTSNPVGRVTIFSLFGVKVEGKLREKNGSNNSVSENIPICSI